MATVTINRNPKPGAFGGDASEVSTAKLRGFFLFEADKNDPLNQLVVAGLMVNERFAIRAAVERGNTASPEGAAIAALAAAVIEHHAEIRDVLVED